jgi:hypothetical protein
MPIVSPPDGIRAAARLPNDEHVVQGVREVEAPDLRPRDIAIDGVCCSHILLLTQVSLLRCRAVQTRGVQELVELATDAHLGSSESCAFKTFERKHLSYLSSLCAKHEAPPLVRACGLTPETRCAIADTAFVQFRARTADATSQLCWIEWSGTVCSRQSALCPQPRLQLSRART